MTNPSTIGRGTTIRGSIRGDGDLDIHGFVEGAVTVQGELLIGETALIKSDVTGRRIIVRGAVAGNVSAAELIVLEPGARVVGDLGAPQIGIRPGALVRGNVSTGGPLPQRAQAPAVTAAAAPAPARGRAAAPAPAPARAHAPAPARAPAPAPARPAPPPARPSPAPRPAPVHAAPPPPPPPPAVVEAETDQADGAAEAPESGGPPPPVVPAVPKGAKAQMRRGRGGGR